MVSSSPTITCPCLRLFQNSDLSRYDMIKRQKQIIFRSKFIQTEEKGVKEKMFFLVTQDFRFESFRSHVFVVVV
jgi:hypothetical protein